jgi:DNA-directed RNA polymerase specialized sigma24 family protein
MTTEWTWNEFCELYFDSAKKSAEIYLQKQARKLGGLDRRVDLDYVRDSAVLTAMEKAYAHYDASKGAKITTYLATLVHNEIVDLVEKESKAAAAQRDIDEVKTAIKALKALADEAPSDTGSSDARAKLIPRLRAAIDKLSPSDQIILNYYLEDKSSYVAKSVHALQVSENYISVRRHRIFKLLPTLMEMTKADYQRFCYDYEGGAFAGGGLMNNDSVLFEMTLTRRRITPVNPIQPSLDLEIMAARLLLECGL